MTPEQQSAMALVERAAKTTHGSLFPILDRENARAIIDMLADPRIYEDVMRKLGKPVAVMPEEPTPEALEAMRLQLVPGTRHNQVALAYRALFLHLPKPPTRTEWQIAGTDKNHLQVTHTTVAAETEIPNAVQAALRAGAERVTIVRRENIDG